MPASSALFAEMTATCQPVLGWGCTWTSCPSSARPSLIISANSSAAILVFCMARLFPHCRASETFYRHRCYFFLASLDTDQRRVLWLLQCFSFRRTVLFGSVARQSHQAN